MTRDDPEARKPAAGGRSEPDGVCRVHAQSGAPGPARLPLWTAVLVRGLGKMRVKTLLFCSTLALAAPTLACAQDATDGEDAVNDDRIIVLATGNRSTIDSTGQALSVITLDELHSVQGIDLTRALERVPGLTWTRNGGPGSFTGVRLRGADAEQVLVLVDGVRVEDVSAPSGGFDFGTLALGEVARIEVLRGSNSVPWGSAALGGVIAVTTRQIDGAEAQVEYGSHDTLSSQATLGMAGDAGAISISGGYSRSDGVSAAAVGTEADGYRNWRASTRGALALMPGLRLVANARLADTRTQIDGFPPPTYMTFGDTPEFQDTRQAGGRAGFDFASDRFSLASGLALAHTRRAYFDPTWSPDPSFSYRGQSLRWDMTGSARGPSGLRLDFGADSEWSHFASTFDARASARETSGHAMLGWNGTQGAVSAGVRHDNHNRFGGAWTLGANGTWKLNEDLRLLASYGEGFKAPTLFQLLSDYGNAALRPETSKTIDLGLALDMQDSGIAMSATVFRRDSRDLITFVSCTSLDRCDDRPSGLYDNVARSRANGVELELGANLPANLRLQTAYAYTEARNRSGLNAGNDLPRRPRHALTTALDWSGDKVTLGADLRWVGASFDDAGNSRRLASHVLVALRASAPVTQRVDVFARVENLFDTAYETVADYGTWGRAAFVGARARY
jgi:vitamin B12 transporter